MMGWTERVTSDSSQVVKLSTLHKRYKMFNQPQCTFVCLFSVSWRTFPSNEWKYEPARALVVDSANRYLTHHRLLADETSQELLRGQETRLTKSSQKIKLVNLIYNKFCTWQVDFHHENKNQARRNCFGYILSGSFDVLITQIILCKKSGYNTQT